MPYMLAAQSGQPVTHGPIAATTNSKQSMRRSYNRLCGRPSEVLDKNVILVVVDKLSKYAHFIHVHHPFLAMDIATIFVCEIIHLHGIPSSKMSDRNTIFLSYVWKEIHYL